jgi:hypothetical protein
LVADPAQRLPSAAALRDALAMARLEGPVVQNPVVQNPVVQNPVVQNPVVQNPVVQDPVDPRAATTAVPTQAGWPNLPPSHPSGPGFGPSVQQPTSAWAPPAPPPAPRRLPIALVAGLAVLGLVVGGLALFVGPGRGLLLPQTGSSSPSSAGSGTGLPTSGSGGPGPTTGGATAAASTSPPESSSSAGPTGAAAILAAVNAYRQAVGGTDPSALEMTFYPNPGPTEQARAIATLPSRANPAIADEYTYSGGAVQAPTPQAVPDVATLSWHFSAVSWSKVAAMLQSTDRVCRAAMRKANLPDVPDQFGDRAGISHVIMERDTAFYGGKVVVRVYFGGGAYWDGGYVPFYADGTKITDSYCTTS